MSDQINQPNETRDLSSIEDSPATKVTPDHPQTR